MNNNTKWIIIALMFFGAMTLHGINNNRPEPEVSSTSTEFEHRCKFLQSIDGGDLLIEEGNLGVFHYEIYSTRGNLTVYKCLK